MNEETEGHEFEPGDTVRLKSGGPVMTVITITPNADERRDDVNVCWFDPTNLSLPIHWRFPPVALVIHESGK